MDTLRLRVLPAFTVDVIESDVQVELVGGETQTGAFPIGGAVTGGNASHVGGTGRHLLLPKGGTGIRVLDREYWATFESASARDHTCPGEG